MIYLYAFYYNIKINYSILFITNRIISFLIEFFFCPAYVFSFRKHMSKDTIVKRKLIIWYNPNTKSYYHKIVRGHYSNYELGFKNNYDHVIVYIIDDIYFKIVKSS